MREYKDILTKKELFANLLFYACRYALYLIAFCCLAVVMGEFFCIIFVGIFGIITRLHMENDIKIQKAIVASEVNKYEQLYIKNKLKYKEDVENRNINNKDEAEK